MPSPCASVLSLLTASGYGWAIVAGDGLVQCANETGVRILTALMRIQVKDTGPIRLSHGFLARLNASAPAPAFFSLPNSNAYVVQRRPFQCNGSSYLLLCIDLKAMKTPDPDLLQRGFGLTPSEARLAATITAGLSLQEIATRFGVGIGTLRTQLKSVFIKTDTRRQSELVALLGQLVLFTIEATASTHSPIWRRQ